MQTPIHISKIFAVLLFLVFAGSATAQNAGDAPSAPAGTLTPQQVADRIAAMHAEHDRQMQQQGQPQPGKILGVGPVPPAATQTTPVHTSPVMPGSTPAKPSAAIPMTPMTPTVQDIPAADAQEAAAPAKPAVLSYNSGQLRVVADNSSLTDILHSIALTTGMKITGAPAEQRVYGSYGPATPLAVLQSLLDGCGCNFVYTHNGPPAGEFTILSDAAETPKAANVGAPAVGNPAAPPVNGGFTGALPPPPPNGVLTPQQVQERIAAMQRARQQQQRPTYGGTPPGEAPAPQN